MFLASSRCALAVAAMCALADAEEFAAPQFLSGLACSLACDMSGATYVEPPSEKGGGRLERKPAWCTCTASYGLLELARSAGLTTQEFVDARVSAPPSAALDAAMAATSWLTRTSGVLKLEREERSCQHMCAVVNLVCLGAADEKGGALVGDCQTAFEPHDIRCVCGSAVKSDASGQVQKLRSGFPLREVMTTVRDLLTPSMGSPLEASPGYLVGHVLELVGSDDPLKACFYEVADWANTIFAEFSRSHEQETLRQKCGTGGLWCSPSAMHDSQDVLFPAKFFAPDTNDAHRLARIMTLIAPDAPSPGQPEGANGVYVSGKRVAQAAFVALQLRESQSRLGTMKEIFGTDANMDVGVGMPRVLRAPNNNVAEAMVGQKITLRKSPNTVLLEEGVQNLCVVPLGRLQRGVAVWPQGAGSPSNTRTTAHFMAKRAIFSSSPWAKVARPALIMPGGESRNIEPGGAELAAMLVAATCRTPETVPMDGRRGRHVQFREQVAAQRSPLVCATAAAQSVPVKSGAGGDIDSIFRFKPDSIDTIVSQLLDEHLQDGVDRRGLAIAYALVTQSMMHASPVHSPVHSPGISSDTDWRLPDAYSGLCARPVCFSHRGTTVSLLEFPDDEPIFDGFVPGTSETISMSLSELKRSRPLTRTSARKKCRKGRTSFAVCLDPVPEVSGTDEDGELATERVAEQTIPSVLLGSPPARAGNSRGTPEQPL